MVTTCTTTTWQNPKYKTAISETRIAKIFKCNFWFYWPCFFPNMKRIKEISFFESTENAYLDYIKINRVSSDDRPTTNGNSTRRSAVNRMVKDIL